jgi:cytochrome b pre-mRNA-processing protein 3
MAKLAGLLGFRGLRRVDRHQTAGFSLYAAAVAAARDPWFYQALGVPDTLDGRFDLVALHAFLLIQRLRDAADPGPTLAQAVFDAMFSDMDNNLREIGVSDLSVGKRVRAMWDAFHGRAKAYASAIEAADGSALAAALARNVWRDAAPEGGAAPLAEVALAQTAHLAGQPLAAFAAGSVRFLATAEVLR